ncbi:platelet binding protein GspB-like isoform X5 [Eurosta solidaginis]|uniref:platelet binding protein GspB-like isoform X5 n=1 Tax=Eurosta solidaginis TaxID=178769 RepID=UPI003530637C
MLAIKECLIREGVLNLTSSTSNHHDINNTATNGFTVATSIVGGGGGGNTLNIGTVGVSVADTNTSAGANNINNIYRYNNNYNDGSAASINNLRAINANYSYNNSNKIGNVNRNNHNYDMASVLALADTLQLAANLSDEKKSVDTTHFVNTNNTTNNENQSSNCSLSSISATAKSNCQPTSKNYDKTKQLQQTQELQRKQLQEKKELQQLHTKSKQQPTAGTNKPTTRYHGVHPHFHHHTAPAYYTDVNLHIHTPKANDVAALNENYQSVYNTPSQLINEHYFPKTSTATVVPPPIGTGTAIIVRANTTSPTSGGDKRDRERERHYYQTTKQQQKIAAPATTKHSLTKATARAAFFRGGSVGNKERKSCEPFVQTTSPAAFGRAAKKGDFLNLNDTKTSYDDITSSHDANTSCDNITDDSSFVACDINETSSECSKIKHLVNKIDTSYINNTNKNNHIPITSPTSTGNTSAGGAASPTGVGNTSTSTGRSHHSNRFAGKKRAVRVRSESRPISALYDIICKEKGLDIGTSATSDENSLSAASNDIENYSGGANTNANQNDGKRNNKQKRRNRSSKERSRSQRSNSRHDSLNTHNDYSEISNCLNAFVANSIATYLGEEGAAGDLAEAILLNTSINPYDMDKNASDRTKRAHKTRTASSQKSVSSKKRKDHGKTSKMQTQTRNSNNTERYAASDDELNGATAESSGDAGARTKSSSARTKYRTIASDGRRHAVKTNGLDKASSLPPRLYGGAHITSPSFCDQEQKHTASCYLNVNGADAYTYAMHKKCPVHCGCQLDKSSSNSIGNRCSSLKHDQNEYHHQAQSLSLPPLPSSPPLNLSLNAGPPSSASCMRSSPITAEDNSSIVAAVDSRISPVKFYVEPINMTLSGMSSGTSPSASAAATAISAKGSVLNNKNANSSSSGVVVTEPTSNSNSSRCNHQRISRAQQRRFREELGRFTDLPQLDLLSPRESEVERAVLSEDEGVVAVVKEGKGRSSKTRRFINRPSRTPSRGRTGNSVNGSPHPSRRGSTHQHNNRSESSESSSTPLSSPPASNGCCASTTNNNRRISSAPTTTSPPPQPVSVFDIGGYSVPVSNISLAGITIEDVGSASSSADHISTLIKLSPLDIMTNSATPATELRPPAHGGVAGAETELNCAASGASNGVVQVAIADALQQCKYDNHTHKTQPNTTARIRSPNTKLNTTTITNAISLNNKSPTNLKECSEQQLQHRQSRQQHQQQNQSTNHNNSTSHNNNNTSKNPNLSYNNSYAMPTETFLLKQKATTSNGISNNSNIPTACTRTKSLSPLVIIPLPSSPSRAAHATKIPSAHQLSHQHSNAQQQQQQSSVGVSKLPQRRQQSPLLGAQAPLSPYAAQARSPLSPCSPHYVRTTKSSRLRAAALDKKKCEEDAALYQRSRSPTSPRPPTLSPKYQSPRPSTSSSSANARDSKLSAISASLPKQPQQAGNGGHKSTTSSVDSPKASKKPIPSVSVSVKQNLSEMHYNGDIKSPSSPRKVILVKPKKQRDPLSPDTECTAKFTHSAGRLSTADIADANLVYSKNGKPLPRPRTTITVKTNKTTTSNEVKSSGGDETSSTQQERSSVNGATPDSSMEERDKSSKRKSNLNRSFNDEATVDSDDSLAARRRRRRELGMVRQLVPSDDAVVREMLLAHQNKPADTNKSTADAKSAQNDLAYHMEIARRGWDLFTTSAIRARSETGSPKYEVCTKEVTKAKSSHARLPRRSDTLHLGELRKLRSNDVNRKVNERTKSDLAEIKKIAEQANVETAMMASGIATELAEQAVQLVDLMSEANGLDPNECFVELPTPPRYGLGCRDKLPPPAPSYAELEVAAEAKERDSLPAKHATFVQEEPIYYDPEKSDQLAKSVSNTSMASGLLRQRMLKARSMERDAGHEPPKLSPILRRRSTDDPAYITIPTTSSSSLHSTSPLATSHNHIVSILKKKDHIAGESSSASSNASPVTFSANVVDTPTTKYKRAGILKKRSSLDESRYYSRSHSPDERSILIKSARRNSLEEIAGLQQQQQQHGILKQSSYESSKSDGCPSATEPHPHGILKKKDSTSTPSDGGTHAPKHVSISQAVKMAAAELGHEAADSQYATAADHDESGYTPNNEEYEIRPILKLESTSSDDAMRPPKPILKKKSSGDSDEYEIRPILKTSRKSSREEFDLGGSLSEDGRHHSEQMQLIPPVRPILKTDSPSKRRSLGGAGTDWLDDQDVFNDAENARESALSLKRRTRSLDRQETPVVDLAEALNAIATSQAAPVEFVSTPITTGGSISVAERIRNMEKFLNSAGNSPTSVADGNSSWDSPLQSGVSPRLLKPSAIKRDMYRDRYKTQPVTNDEKMLFKANASPLDTSSTSAFKPAKSLDAGLNYTTFAHLNAPSAASSHTPGSTYTLTRCATQPVHPQQYQCNQFNAGIGAETVATSTPPLRQLNSVSDTTTTPTTNSYNNSNSISEQLTLSLGSDSERIFEMSGINDSSLLATSEGVQSQREGSGSVVGSGGLSRQNSVRARANMFQQMQEKKKSVEGAASTAAGLSREGQTSPRRALPQFSPTSAMLSTPPIMSSSLNSNDEPNTTPQNPPRTDEEIEPTSLPVSERLRFFTNLAQAANRCASSSYARSPPQRYLSTDRCSSVNSYNYSNNNSFTFSPRSSYNGGSSTGTSSASVTPTPMDCCQSPPLLCQPQLISINEIDSALKMKARTTNNSDGTQSARSAAPTITLSNGTHETSAFIKLTKSSSQTSLPSVVAQRLLMTTATAPARNTTEAHAITSASELTPITRRIKMKSVGKLLLPYTFLNNERNHSSNNNSNGGNSNTSGSSNDSGVMNGYSDAFDNGESNNNDGVSKPPLVKKIGKIKSPFIENCLQMQQKNHQLNSKCMKYDHKSTPHNALAALENNVTNAAGGERDISLLAARKPLQNGNAAPATPLITHVADSENDIRQADAGKENNYCETNGVPLLTLSPTASSIAVIEQTNSPVVEMRKKFTRIMSSSTLSTMAQRHTAYGLSNGGLNVHGNGSLSSGNSSSAPTTPRNSIIDEKFAKYFGLKPSTSTCCTPTITTIPANKATIDSVQKVNDAHPRLLGAGETRNLTHNANKSPPLPPPDFVHTINGSAGASMTMEYANNNHEESYSTPLEAINHNVRSNSNTPYYTPLANGFFDITATVAAPGSALDALSNSVQTVTDGAVNALQRRRDMAKRPRANTTNNTFTPTTSSVQAAAASPTPYGTSTPTTPGSGRTRALRARALTLTNGVLLPEVKRYEDIVVTIEEFQSASREFERIFLDVI